MTPDSKVRAALIVDAFAAKPAAERAGACAIFPDNSSRRSCCVSCERSAGRTSPDQRPRHRSLGARCRYRPGGRPHVLWLNCSISSRAYGARWGTPPPLPPLAAQPTLGHWNGPFRITGCFVDPGQQLRDPPEGSPALLRLELLPFAEGELPRRAPVDRISGPEVVERWWC